MIPALKRIAATAALIALVLAAAGQIADESTFAKAGAAPAAKSTITLRQFEARWAGSGASARGDVAMQRAKEIEVAAR